MSPRPYNLEKRRAAAEQTRSRILQAARELIMASSVPPSIDAVAAQAGVARMTVYYQFGSKAGLLEALFDGLGGRYFRSELPRFMSQGEPLQALADLIELFLTFWSAERLVTRRIRGMAALDSEFEQSLRGRDERRKLLLRTILSRITQKYRKPSSEVVEQSVDLLYALTSFATFDAMAGDDGKADANIERKTVRGHPGAARAARPAHTNADRRDLLATNPNTCEAALKPAPDAVVMKSAHGHLLQIANVIHDAKARRPEVDNRISDELAGAVERYVASPVGGDQRRTERIGWEAKVRFGVSLSGGEHGRVLEK